MPVSLQNLLRIGQLKEHPPDAAEVRRRLAAAARNHADARVVNTRFLRRSTAPLKYFSPILLIYSMYLS